jgi:outer membrane protein OmpA-like peptidoglycan-associated protein
MTRTLLLASIAFVPTLAFAQPVALTERPMIVAQNEQKPDEKKPAEKPQPAKPQPPKPQAQPQPPKPPSAPPPPQQRHVEPPKPPAAQPSQPRQVQPPATVQPPPQQRQVQPPPAVRPQPPQQQAQPPKPQTVQPPAQQPAPQAQPQQQRQFNGRPGRPEPQAPGRVQQQPAAPQAPAATQTPQAPAAIQQRQQSNQPQQQNVQQPNNRPQAQERREDRRLDALRGERKERRQGNSTVIQERDRTIVRQGNRAIIRHDDDTRFRRSGANEQVVRRGDRTERVIQRPNGVRVVTTVDANGRVLRRSRFVNGREYVLFRNRPATGFNFIINVPPPIVRIPRDRYIVEYRDAPPALIYDTLIAPPVMVLDRRFSMDEVLYNYDVRARMPRIDIDSITFDTGSWDIRPDQAAKLEPIAQAMMRAIQANPNEVYLIEGHTDAVGSEDDNLSLSDRRAQAVTEVLTEEFGVPPENMIPQGYGEQNLKVPTQGPEERNRYVSVRRVTPLLAQQQ